MRTSVLVTSSLALAAFAPSADAGVTVVAPTGGEHASIADAVDAAPDGEIVLVRAGAYGSFAIHGKSVHVVADAGALVEVHGSVLVDLLPAGGTVTLQGLRIVQPT